VSNTHNNYPIPDAKRPVGRIGATGAADEGWDDFTPLTPEQALRLREKQSPVSPWWILGWQALVGLAVSLLAWLATGKGNVAASALYGAVAVVVPGAVFARGLSSRLTRRNAGSAVAGFLLWEMVKIALTVAMLFAVGKVVADLSWPALLLGLVVTMKVYWLGLRARPDKTGHKSGS
jgi:ATP synthase protein I